MSLRVAYVYLMSAGWTGLEATRIITAVLATGPLTMDRLREESNRRRTG